MNTIKSNYKVIYYLLVIPLSLIYTYVLISIPNSFFRDRDVYLVYAENSQSLYDYYSGFLVYFNEPIFLKLNILLNGFFSSESIINIYLFFIILSTLFFLIKFSKNLLMFFLGVILLLVCHYSFHGQLVVLRQSIATLILCYALVFSSNKKIHIIVSLLCSFIHSSFFVITGLIFIYQLLVKFSYITRSIIITFFSATIGIFITVIGSYLGVRQASEDHITSAVNVGGGAFLCFLMILIYFLYFYKVRSKEINIYNFTILGLSMFIGLYFVNPAAGRFMSTFIFTIIFLLSSRSNLISLFLMFILICIFGYLDSQGVMSGMSLNVGFDQVFNFIRVNILP